MDNGTTIDTSGNIDAEINLNIERCKLLLARPSGFKHNIGILATEFNNVKITIFTSVMQQRPTSRRTSGTLEIRADS